MRTQDDAFAAVRAFLADVPSLGQFTLVVQPELSQEHPIAWLVRFDSREHLDTGDLSRAPFTRVVVVPKDGSGVHFPPTHLPVAEYLDLVVRGAWPPGKA